MSEWMTAAPASGDGHQHYVGDGHNHDDTLGGGNSYMWNLDADFKNRLQAFIRASQGRVGMVSGFRSEEHQARLYQAGIAKHGEENVRRWVAPPGGSNHNHGLAGDLSYMDDAAKQWAHENAAKFGLEFPMAHEPWHIEPAGLRKGSYQKGQQAFNVAREAYTFFDGHAHPMDIDDKMQTYADVVQNVFSLGPAAEGEQQPTLVQEQQIDGEEGVTDG